MYMCQNWHIHSDTRRPIITYRRTDNSWIVWATSFNTRIRRGEPCVRPFLFVLAQNRPAYAPRRKPACANVSEEKRRTVWAEGEFSTFSERAHPAGRLGASSLDLLLLRFLVSRQENEVGLGNAQEKTFNNTQYMGLPRLFAPLIIVFALYPFKHLND